jgi:ParB family transcriptional regulator, chromosome partitioning protein
VPTQRRGLGRGLGALIPAGPPAQATAGDSTYVEPGVAGLAGDSGNGRSAHRESPVSTFLFRQEPPAPSDGAIEDAGRIDSDRSVANGGDPDGVGYFAQLPLDSMQPNPRQPRQVFDEDELAELVHSISEIGLLQPVVVRPLPSDDGGPRYELVMGERRWRASQLAGTRTIPAIVRSTADDAMLRDALLENLHRAQLNPLEEAAAYGQLLDDFGCTHEELATRIRRSRPQISNTLRLLKLPPAVQRRVAAGVLSAGHARALVGVADADHADRLASRVVAEGLSVRALEEIVTLSDDSKPRSVHRGQHSRVVDEGTADLAERLSDRFDTRVRVEAGRTRGRIIIDFATAADLERIAQLLDPQPSS